MKRWIGITASILLCEFVGIAGSFFTISSIGAWYGTLNKPFFSPPNWIFGPVWSLLYALMGVSFYLVWEKFKKTKKGHEAIKFFVIQLILNGVWTPVFFGVHDILLALIIILVMWLFILKTILAFAKINKTASYLLYPYLAWVSFASLLNFSLWFLNR